MMLQEPFFDKKIPKIHTLHDFAGNHLSIWIITKFGKKMPDTCGHGTGGSKFLNYFLVQTIWSRSQERAQNALTWYFVILLSPT